MKKITLWLFLLIGFISYSQISISQNFANTTTPAGWGIGGGTLTTIQACATASWRFNVYSSSSTSSNNLSSETFVSTGESLTVSFDYKIVNWSAATAATTPYNGTVTIQTSSDGGLTYGYDVVAVNTANHTVANTCATKSVVIPGSSVPFGANTKIRFKCNFGTSGDYYVYLDNISLTQGASSACSGTPAPGNVIFPSTICNGSSATLSLQNATSGSGVTYQWYMNSVAISGANSATYVIPSVTSTANYYCEVTCSTNMAASSTVAVGPTAFTAPLSEPFTTFLPNCWSNMSGGDLTTGPTLTTGSGWLADGLANNGTTGAIRNNIYTTGANDWVISPVINIPVSGYELKFDAAAVQFDATTAPTTPWDTDDFIEVLISPSGALTNWTPLFTYNDTNQPGIVATPNIIDLDAYAGQNVRFAFRAVEGATDGSADIDFSIDNFQIRLTPSCVEPLGLVSASVTWNGASVSWDAPATPPALGYEYFVSTTNTTPTAAGTATTNPYALLTGLLSNTPYYIFVRSVCGSSDFSPWSASISFTTACAPVTSFNENFDGVTTPALPSCWGKILSGATLSTFASVGTSTTNASAPNGVSLYNSSSTATDNIMLVSPTLSNLSAGTHRLKFKARNSSATQDLEIGVLTNPADATTFTLVQAVDITTTFENYVVNFAGFTGPGAVIALRRLSTSTYTYVYLDDIVWEAIPTCVEPTALVYANITSSGVDVSWTAPTTAPASGYEYVISTSATAPTTAGTAVTNTYVSVSGLTPQTTYYVYVRSVCSTTDASPWVGPVSILTACLPVTALPWIENFDAVTTPAFPPCWSEENGDYTTSSDTFYNTAYSGTNYLRDAWSATNEFMWTPGFQLTAGTSYDFSSWVQGDGGNGWVVDYFVNSSQVSTGATQLGAAYNVPGTGTLAIQQYAKITRTFVPTTSGVYYFAFRVNQPNFAPYYVAFDNVELKVTPNIIPSCATGLTSVPNATCGNFANQLSWSATQDATGYYVTIGTTSGGTDIANAVSVSATNYSFLGNVNTQYFWKVVPFSGAGAATGCTVQSFTTVANGCYCPSVPTSNDGSGITNATVGTSPFVIADVMYVNNTATAIAVEPGTNTNVQLTFATGYDYDVNIWIDFNNDFDFDDAGELVKTGIACTAVNPNTLDASFLMPLTAPTGAHRMRIGTADEGQVPPNPCYSGSYGVTLDFKVDTTLGSNSFDTSNFVAYPNPVKDVLNLSYKTAISNVKVINLLGQEVVNAKANTNDVQVDRSALKAGVYIVNVTVDDTVHSLKIIKE